LVHIVTPQHEIPPENDFLQSHFELALLDQPNFTDEFQIWRAPGKTRRISP